MSFIDWNNNGEIDPVDIGISIAMESDNAEETPPSESPRKPAAGCLTTIMTFIGVLAIAAACLWAIL